MKKTDNRFKEKRRGQMSEEEERIHKRNFDQAMADYNSRYDYFARRKRSRDYLRGQQWNDMIYDNKFDDEVREEEYLRRRGRLTTKNNQIDPIIRNLVGQFRESYPSSIVYARNNDAKGIGDVMTEALRYIEDLNVAEEIDVQQFREALISGAWGNRVEFSWFQQLYKSEVSMEPIEQRRFAYNADLQDIRIKDLKRWVYLHDIEIDEIIETYAESPKEAERIAEWYGRDKRDHYVHWDQLTGSDIADSMNFYISNEFGKERVIEVWRIDRKWQNVIHDHQSGEHGPTEMSEDEIQLINDERVEKLVAIKVQMMEAAGAKPTNKDKAEIRDLLIEENAVPLIEFEQRFVGVWHTYHYTPWGDVLFEAETPYDHQESPIELSLHPMIDGEVYGLIESIIDQQKYFNRMISMLDFLISSSAKGVLMIDKNMVPKEYIGKNEDGTDNLDKFVENWTEFDGVIYYQSDPNNPGNMPQHIVNQSMPAGMNDMIRLQHDLLEKISGVVGPVAGHNPSSGTPASLYMQQTVNASMTNRDIFESFFSWMRRRNRKAVQLIQQFWEDATYVKAGGKRSTSRTVMKYNPNKIRNVDFDLVMGEGQQSTVFRQVIDESLKEYLLNGLITFEEYLEESTLPYAENLLQKIRERNRAMQAEQGGAPQQGGQPPMPQAQGQPPQQGQPAQPPQDPERAVENQRRQETQ